MPSSASSERTSPVNEYIVKRLTELAEEDAPLQRLLVQEAHERQAAGSEGDTDHLGSLVFAEACEETAKRLFSHLKPINTVQKGQYL